VRGAGAEPASDDRPVTWPMSRSLRSSGMMPRVMMAWVSRCLRVVKVSLCTVPLSGAGEWSG
jgi:hypothetical protein